MEPAVTGTSTLSGVSISSLALMKLVQHGTRSLPELCAGSLLGLDDGEGQLEVTGCFPYPSASSMTAAAFAEDGEELDANQIEADISDFRLDYMRLLRDCQSSDDFCVGWYRTVNMGDWCTLDIVEQQYEHQEECDAQTGKAKSVLVIYDPYQTENGVLAIKALRLTDAFMDVMRVRLSSDPKHMSASDVALSQMKMGDVFYEIPIAFTSGGTLAARAVEQFAPLAETVQFDRLVLDPNPKLEKNLAFAVEELEHLKSEAQNGANFQKFMVKQKQQQELWVAQRKQENLHREKRGEEPLPLRDLSLSFFKTYRDASKLNTLLIRKQIQVYCEQVDEAANNSFEKLRLLGALQQ